MNKMNKMNKMKRFLIAVMVAIMFGSSFVSCIDSEVSPEIKRIYQGQADLLASQVAVNQAEATLKAAEATLKAAEATLRTAEAALRTAEAAVQTAGAARIDAETLSNVTAAEVAVKKAEAEIARMLAETASGVAAAEVAVRKAEVEIARMLAETANGVTAAEVAVRKAEAEIARMLAETTSGVAAAEVAAAKVRAEVAKMLAETANGVAAAEVAVRKAEAEIARIVAETASGVATAEVAAAKVRAEAELKEAEAELKKADAAHRMAEVVKILAESSNALAIAEINTAVARLELLKAQNDHANSLREAGFVAAQTLFAQYTTYRDLASTKLATRKITALVLRDELKALATGKIDSVVDKASLASLRALKTAAEVGLQVAQVAVIAAQNDESATQKADFDAIVNAYNDTIKQVQLKIKLKEGDINIKRNEEIVEVRKLKELTGTSRLRAEYDSIAGLIDIDSTSYNSSKKSIKAKEKKLLTYDVDLAKLVAKVAAAKSFGAGPYNDAEAKRKAYNTLKADVGVFLDSLTMTTEALKTHIAAKTDIEGIRKTAADARKLHDSLKDIYDADPAGPSIFAGPDGTLGNHDDDPATGKNKTYRQIGSVIEAGRDIFSQDTVKFKVVFRTGAYPSKADGSDPEFPLNLSTTVDKTDRWTKYTGDYGDIAAADIGKLFDVEFDDREPKDKELNVNKFNAAVIALDAAIRELNASEASLADDSATEEKLRDKIAKFDGLLVDNAGVTLKATETAFIAALKAIGIKGAKVVVLATTKEAITAKKVSDKATALSKAQTAKTNFEAEDKDALNLNIKLLGIDIAGFAAKITGNTAKLVALDVEIASASSATNVAGVSELVSSINAIQAEKEDLEAEKEDLEARKILMMLLRDKYSEVSGLISISLEALKGKVTSAKESLITATNHLVAKEKMISNGWFDRAASTELIWVLKLELAAMDAEILELIGLANKYKALAEAALEAAITA